MASGCVSNRVRHDVLERDGFTCRLCGLVGFCRKYRDYGTPVRGVYLSVDHIEPKSKGGSNEMDNLRCVCTVCNTRKGVKPAHAFDVTVTRVA